ncbi:MAG: fibronectin type III domain-containing protein [Candidatus Glassbacteria bacterium]|nr:fibronectin type III domain-containing protein [Candidatus Glassbacteria bacterium]
MSGIYQKAALWMIFILACPLWAAAEEGPEIKTHSQVITEPRAEYAIEVGGTLDPENVEVVIENLGDTPVIDPRLSVNGLYDWYDIAAMTGEITAGCDTEEEKALAIWQWVHWKRFQRSPQDHSALHPVRAMNGYGYGICGHTAAWLKALWAAAGLQARVQEIWGHTISEVYYDGGWHMLDGNVKVFYLARDNRTIASLAELEKDAWLIERTIHPRDPWVRQPDPPGRNREFVRYIVSYKDNYEEHSYDSEIGRDYNMSCTLKPGEKLIRWWEPVLNKHEGRDKRPLVPERYANGQLVWEPDLEKTDVLDYLRVIENVTTRQRDSQGPAIHVAELHSRLNTRPARFTIPIHSPYPVVGGRFWCSLVKEGSGDNLASVFFGEPELGPGGLYTFRWGSGTENLELDLDQSLLSAAPVYDYAVGFALKGSGESDPPAQAGVGWFKSVSDLQVSPHSLPALSTGRNVVRYRDSSPGPRTVRITHSWRETTGNRPPGRVTEAVSPAGPAPVKKLAPTLKWSPAADPEPGDRVADYQVMVSLRPDCRWPVSMTLFQNVGSDKCEWKVPESFLNPGTTYYWRVRARDDKGHIGEWGRVFAFTTSAGAK